MPFTQEILCAEYQSVYRYVLSLCRDPAEAEDITQETFLRAMRSQKIFRGESSLYTWLCTIAKNILFDRGRRSRKERESTVLLQNDAQGPSLQQMIDEKDTSMQIHRILHGLQEPYKEVFSLRVFGQLSFADIAALFVKSENWARVTYHRARKKISEALREDEDHE